jgi:23S rRNA (uracil1939-C5)-methyltransferase
VSCNPATLARDCAIFVHEGGWTLAAAGVVNMFPHTSHVESLAVLEPPQQGADGQPPAC